MITPNALKVVSKARRADASWTPIRRLGEAGAALAARKQVIAVGIGGNKNKKKRRRKEKKGKEIG